MMIYDGVRGKKQIKVYFFPFFPLLATAAALLAIGSAAGFLPCFLALSASLARRRLAATSAAFFFSTPACGFSCSRALTLRSGFFFGTALLTFRFGARRAWEGRKKKESRKRFNEDVKFRYFFTLSLPCGSPRS